MKPTKRFGRRGLLAVLGLAVTVVICDGFSAVASSSGATADPSGVHAQECLTQSGTPTVALPLFGYAGAMFQRRFSYVDRLSGTQSHWTGDVPFSNQVIDHAAIPSLQGLDRIPLVPGGSALAALGSQFSNLYQSNRASYNSMEHSFKSGYFGAINDAEAKLAALAGLNSQTLQKKIGAQFVEALTVFDPAHPDTLPKAMLVGGSLCVHADGSLTTGNMQIGTSPSCSGGKTFEVLTAYSIEFDPKAARLALLLKSAGIQKVESEFFPETQVGSDLSALQFGH